ncbi:D-alanyl-D-alanine carboxypeptidase/D-alanyl-D-alanine-endopeptidase [bacterium]|nr:D-alanyl-D-alanine carboxypeptidase/D-alanyl-D-alanine-endopeptidase [bacterium]
MPRSPFFLLALLVCLVLIQPVSSAPLDSRIEKVISEGAARRAIWGVYAVDAKSGDVLADVNGTRLLVPASNRKIVATSMITTAYKADDRLSTEVRAVGSVSGGVLKGNLAIMAVGDPSWTPSLLGGATGATRLRALAKFVSAAGITRVDGDLIIDTGPFGSEPDPVPPGWSWEEFSVSYGSTPSALAVNRNLVGVSMAPSAVGRPIDVTFPGLVDPFSVVNESMTLSPGSAPTLSVERLSGGESIRLRGGMAAGSNPVSRAIPAGRPTLVAGRMFIDSLSREGVTVTGEVRIGSVGSGEGKTLGAVEGATFAEIIKECNEDSDNYLAESLYLLAAARLGGRANYPSAQAVESRYWRSIKLDESLVISADGSGLSRKNGIAPAALVAALRDRKDTDWFVASLPRSGYSGTLRGRLGGNLAGRVNAKTGTLDGTSALSGYVKGSSGRTIVFSIIANNHSSSNSPIRSSIDRIVEIIAER